MNNQGTNWVQTSDALPYQEGNYLITTCVGNIDIAYWDGNSWIKSLTYHGPNGDHTVTSKTNAYLVTAWAYLPEPYKEVKQNDV